MLRYRNNNITHVKIWAGEKYWPGDFGTEFSEEDRYFFEGVIQTLARNQNIEEAAMANHLDGLQIVLRDYLNEALLSQLESHEEFVVKSTADEDIFTMLLSYAAKKLHKQFRDPQRPLPL